MLRLLGIHIKQSPHAHVTTITCIKFLAHSVHNGCVCVYNNKDHNTNLSPNELAHSLFFLPVLFLLMCFLCKLYNNYTIILLHVQIYTHSTTIN